MYVCGAYVQCTLMSAGAHERCFHVFFLSEVYHVPFTMNMIGRHYNPTNKPKHAFLPEREGLGCLQRRRVEYLLLLGSRWGSYRRLW